MTMVNFLWPFMVVAYSDADVGLDCSFVSSSKLHHSNVPSLRPAAMSSSIFYRSWTKFAQVEVGLSDRPVIDSCQEVLGRKSSPGSHLIQA